LAKHFYQIGIDSIKHFISKNQAGINKNIINNEKFELSKVFGRAYYEIAIKEFFREFRLDKEPKHAIQILNIFKSVKFIDEIYKYTGLSKFEDIDYVSKADNSSLKDYKKSIFYSFIYFLYVYENEQKRKIQSQLLSKYFLHYVSTINYKTNTELNYKNMTLSYVKGKDINIKESYKIDNDTQTVSFKILIDNKVIIDIVGKSVKTLRKKAFKQIFFYLLDKKGRI